MKHLHVEHMIYGSVWKKNNVSKEAPCSKATQHLDSPKWNFLLNLSIYIIQPTSADFILCIQGVMRMKKGIQKALSARWDMEKARA